MCINEIYFDLQNTNLTWHSDVPDFTTCFEQTVLIWVPCAFLWLLLPLEIYYMKSSPTKDIPYSFWNLSKLVLSAGIVILTCIDLGIAIKYKDSPDDIIFPVHFYTPIIKIATIVSMHLLSYRMHLKMIVFVITFAGSVNMSSVL